MPAGISNFLELCAECILSGLMFFVRVKDCNKIETDSEYSLQPEYQKIEQTDTSHMKQSKK